MNGMIGSDPEFMIEDVSTGRIISAVGLIGGTKKAPRPMAGLGEGFAMQEDNVMVEFNIPPSATVSGFCANIQLALAHMTNHIQNISPDYGIHCHSTALVHHDQLRSAQAKEFGCSPDYDAYSEGQPAPRVSASSFDTEQGAWRFGGGHVHMGYTADVPPYVVAQLMDVFVGLRSIRTGLDIQGLRRQSYGQAGRFRPTPYGMEYRTLSNYWLWSPRRSSVVATGARKVHCLLEGNLDDLRRAYSATPWADVQLAINTEDTRLAAELDPYLSSIYD